MFLVGVMFLVACALALGWLPTHVKYCEQSPQTNHKECATYHIALVAVWQVGKLLDAIAAPLTALATVAIGYFTFTLKASTDRLWIAGEKARKLSENTAKQQLRAYLSIESAISEGEHPYTPEFKAKIIFKNCGQTPAYEGAIRMSIYAYPQHPIIQVSEKIRVIAFEMPPGNAITTRPAIYSDKLLFSKEAIKGLDKGRVAIYIRGRAEFKDAFGEKRWFNFRLRYDWRCFATGEINIDKIRSN